MRYMRGRSLSFIESNEQQNKSFMALCFLTREREKEKNTDFEIFVIDIYM
jgi:hypothetical protein